jgi:hypothetical protein
MHQKRFGGWAPSGPAGRGAHCAPPGLLAGLKLAASRQWRGRRKGIEKEKGRWLGGEAERKDLCGQYTIFYMVRPMFDAHQRQTYCLAALISSPLKESDQVKIACSQYTELPNKPSVVKA